METGEALCCYRVTRRDELLQDIYLEDDLSG
jgi:rolling-cycle type replication protein